MSGYKKRERRQVSFNTEDAVELELLKFIDRKDINFSGLVKNLLFAYCMGQLKADEPSAPLLQAASNGTLNNSKIEQSSSFQQIKASGMPFDF
ncbi:hypothetical protein [Laceyella putida]|uniref:Uncharacterized protein n=1 Tax=Laceyella putida TaxID=110101 RepID=A0ABW2RGL2_9BACL